METLSHLYPLNKGGYGLTVSETKEFMFSFAENYDIELCNKDVYLTTMVKRLSSVLIIES